MGGPKKQKGGRWLFNLEKRERRELLDLCWLETVECVILNCSLILFVCHFLFLANVSHRGRI